MREGKNMASVKVNVRYHIEPEGTWAESDDVPGFSAAGATLSEVRDLVREGLEFHLDGKPFELAEEMAQPTRYVRPEKLKASPFVNKSFTTAAVAVRKFHMADVQARHSTPKATEAPDVSWTKKSVPA